MAELTTELDAILGADEIGQLGDRDDDRAAGPGRPARATSRHRVSAERRGLHERIDTLQAEIVSATSRACLGRRPAVMKDPVGHDGDRFVKELPERFNDLGSFIREQRSSARLSLRRLSELAGISNPYLSQIERGPAPAVGRDPPADRQGPADLGRDPVRPGRASSSARPATPTCPGRSWPTRT